MNRGRTELAIPILIILCAFGASSATSDVNVFQSSSGRSFAATVTPCQARDFSVLDSWHTLGADSIDNRDAGFFTLEVGNDGQGVKGVSFDHQTSPTWRQSSPNASRRVRSLAVYPI